MNLSGKIQITTNAGVGIFSKDFQFSTEVGMESTNFNQAIPLPSISRIASTNQSNALWFNSANDKDRSKGGNDKNTLRQGEWDKCLIEDLIFQEEMQ